MFGKAGSLRRAVAVLAAVSTFVVMATAASTPAQAQWTDCKVKCLKNYGECGRPCNGAVMSDSEKFACMRVCVTENNKCTDVCRAQEKPKP